MRKLVLVAMALVFLACLSFAATLSAQVTHYVAPESSNDWNVCISPDMPCSLITMFLQGSAGDIVHFAAGTYRVPPLLVMVDDVTSHSFCENMYRKKQMLLEQVCIIPALGEVDTAQFIPVKDPIIIVPASGIWVKQPIGINCVVPNQSLSPTPPWPFITE